MIRFLTIVFLSISTLGAAQEKYAPMHRLTWDEYASTLVHWRKQHPDWVSLESRGMSGQNMPVYLLKITDKSVPDADKQVCLVTTLHCGPERSGATGALALAEWLLGDDPLAAETRRRQIVLLMPVVNPLALFYTDRFQNEHGVDPYTGSGRLGKLWDVKTLSLLKPEQAPELVAVLSVIDEYRPEVHADLHGTGMQEFSSPQLGSRRMYQGTIMTEVTGSAYSNYALRPWDWRVTEAMVEAGVEAGFPSDRFEADAQRTFWGPDLAPLGRKLWHGMPLFYSAHYGYAKYHTMILALEVAWEQSLVARMKGLLRIGNGVWRDERAPGYPVNRMRHFVGHYATAYGEDAAKRRQSRVELWSKQDKFALGFLYPQTDGRESFVCAVTAAAKRAVAVDNVDSLRANLSSFLGSKAANIAKFIGDGPEIKLAMEQAPQQLLAAQAGDDVKIEHGIGFRLRLPYRDPRNLVVQLNGEPLARSPSDGFESWFADGFTQVQVNVPPPKAAGTGLFMITCSYEPDTVRVTGWMPPAEVQKETATAKALAAPATLVDVPYGSHFRQTMDVWLARSDKPSPLVFYIHGGGWAAQDKTDIHQHLDVRGLLKSGISLVSINYRLLQDARATEVTPPVRWPLEDGMRALQFVRSKSGEWHIDKSRIAATGVSAGGASSLWLGLHDDMADAQNSDPIARESTRLFCIAVKAPVVSLDPQQVRGWIPNAIFGAHAFGYADLNRAASFAPFLAAREKHLPDIRRYSPYEHASKDDPPVFLEFPNQDKPPVPGEAQTDPSHSAISGLMLERRLQEIGVKVELRYKNDGRTGHKNVQEYLTKALTAP
jgi:acetyl esterase/lipase